MKVVLSRLSLFCVSVIVTSLMLVGQSDAKIDLSTIVGLWLFDEGAGNVASDSSANGNHGTLTNGPKWVQGTFGMALEFDGQDDYVVSSSNVGISGNAERTVVLWIKPTSSDGFQPVVSLGVAGGQKAYWVEYNGNEGGPNTIRVCGYDGDVFTRATLPLGQWHHVAVVYPGKISGTKLYYLIFRILEIGLGTQNTMITGNRMESKRNMVRLMYLPILLVAGMIISCMRHSETSKVLVNREERFRQEKEQKFLLVPGPTR